MGCVAFPRSADAGVKSEAALHKHASLGSLISDGKAVTFTPYRNSGATVNYKGLSPIDECGIQVDPTTQDVTSETELGTFGPCT